MFERSEFALKIFCGAMALVVIYRLGLVIVHINPLYHLAIPPLPTLSSSTSTNAGGDVTKVAAKKSASTNAGHLSASAATNPPASGTNALAHSREHPTSGTNLVAGHMNLVGGATNVLALSTNGTSHSTNSIAHSTNASSTVAANNPETSMPPNGHRRGMLGGPMPGMPGMPGGGPELPPQIQARIDRVIESEILAPVMRPLPMALLGIAGKDVFLRAPNGQTGLIKEGDELGGVKLVRIGVNRVLVEEQGERKELTIFAGLGSDSLLPTQKDSSK